MKQIVIKISDEDYKAISKGYLPYGAIADALKNGTVLPEYRGRLIDVDRLTRAEIMHLWYHLPNGDIACPKVDIDHAPTIIEGSESE